MKLDTFFAQHQIFTVNELENCLSKELGNTFNYSTLHNSLAYHQKIGRLFRIRRGLYYSIPRGENPSTYPVDPFLVTSKLAQDAVLGYRTALDVHGKSHTVTEKFIYLTKKRVMAPFTFKGVEYQAVSIPTALKTPQQKQFGVQVVDRLGQSILVTSLERTLVDVLDRPYLCGSWEEIWRSLESIEYLNLEQVVAYAKLLDNATTYARVAFFLDQHREMLGLSEKDLVVFDAFKPKSPHYLDRHSKEPNQLIARWNLIVPKSLLQRVWEEPHENF